MSRGKKLMALMGVLILLCAATLLVLRLTPDGGEEEDAGFSLFSAESDTITGLSWTYEEETVNLAKDEDGSWLCSDDENFPLDESQLDTMLSTLADVTSSRAIEAPEDLAEYGLEEPVCSITVTTGEGETSFLVGSKSEMDSSYYVSTGDGNVYLVGAKLLTSFSCGLYDLVQTEELPVMSDLQSFSVEADTQSLELSYQTASGLAYSDEYVWFLQEGADYLPLSTKLTEDFVEQITQLKWSECVTYDADSEALHTYGLDAPSATVIIHYVESVQVDTGETDEDGNPVYETSQAKRIFRLEIGGYAGSYCYARIGGSSMVYLIDASICDSLLYTTYADLRDDDVFKMNWDTVDSMDVILDGRTYTLERHIRTETDEDGETTEKTYFALDGEEMNISSLKTKLLGISSTGSDDSLTPQRSEIIRFVFHRNTETFSEVELVFYDYDSSSCIAGLNGETRLFVDRSDVEAIVSAFEKNLPDADENG